MISEVSILTLAINLMNNPTAKDIEVYSKLPDYTKTRIEKIVNEKDRLPLDFENLKNNTIDIEKVLEAPTGETSGAIPN